MAAPLAVKKAPPLGQGEFRFLTKAVQIDAAGDNADGKRRFRMVASSTVVDEGKDEIKMSALEDLRDAYAAGRNVFTDHEHKVDNVFGRTDTALIKDSGERDPKTGAPIYDLHVAGIVNEPDPRMVRLADSIDGGYVTFGASIGAKVREAKRNKAGGMDIYRLDGKEVSLVGIPMNQRGWTYKSSLIDRAVKAVEKVGGDFLDEGDDDDEPVEKAEVVVAETAIVIERALDTAEGEPLVRQDLEGPKCPDCAGDHDAPGCDNAYHTHKSADADVTPVAADGQESESEPTKVASAEPPETPEPASAVEDETAKTFSFETTDVVELALKARDLAEAVSDRDDQIAALKAENDRLTSENEDARQVIEKMMALPLRAKSAAVATDFTRRVPDFFAPEIRSFLTKTAGDSK